MKRSTYARVMRYAAPSYENFIGFIREFVAPLMQMPFVEEPYYRRLYEDCWLHRKTIALVSRGHSKSELIAVWMTLYFAITQPNNPHYEKEHGQRKQILQQLIVSSDGKTTDELFDRLKHYLVYSDFLQEWIPSTSDQERWNSDKIVLENGSTIYARAIKMKRGLHLDRVVCDDLTTESSTLSDDETWGFFTGALLPQTTTKTAIITVDGTPIRVTDINSRLAREDNGWNKVKLPAIIDPEMKTLLSPGRFTWQGLMEVKRDIGSIKFEAEYMLNPIDDSVSLIKNAWVRQCFDNGTDLCRHRSYFQEVFLGVDFAFSDRVTADWSIFLIIGRHDGKFYLLDYERRQGMGGSEQLEHVRELHSSYRFDMIGLEENSIMALTKEVRRMGLPIKLFRTGTVDEKDKLKPDMTGTIAVSKRNLVLRLATTFENNDIVIPFKSDEAKRKAEQLLNECVSWAQEEGKLVELGVHPDIPMALGFALEAATRSSFIIDFATF